MTPHPYTPTTAQEKHIMDAWNKRHGKQRWFTTQNWMYFVNTPYHIRGHKMPRRFRDNFIARMVKSGLWEEAL